MYLTELPASCLPDHCFCERIATGPIAQAVDAWSGFFFVIAGIAVLYLTWKKNSYVNPATTRRGYGIVYAAVLIFLLGFGTFYFHATLNFLGQYIDGMGISLIATSVLFYRYYDSHCRFHHVLFWFITVNIVAFVLVFEFHLARYILGVTIGAILMLEAELRWKYHIKIKTKYLLYALLSFVVGFIIWILDIQKIMCKPDSLIQGHAIWHACVALAGLFIFMYYRSESRTICVR